MNANLPQSMHAYVIHAPGGAEQFVLSEVATPLIGDEEVLIKVRAFGLNRSEWFTRRGDSPSVQFPRILGIECVGEIVADQRGEFARGQTVAAMMGGMGRGFDGSYAHYVAVPRTIVFPLHTSLDWRLLGALPEMLQTTHGSLYSALDIAAADNILIRGGTSSIGFAAITIAHAAGLRVAATTRSKANVEVLERAGASTVIIDDGDIAATVRAHFPGGCDRVLELIGTSTLIDSLAATRSGGTVCMTGILGGSWSLNDFYPMDDIPNCVKLTSYSGNAADISAQELQAYVELVERDTLRVQLGPSFSFDELPDAHRLMDTNSANGKIVVVV